MTTGSATSADGTAIGYLRVGTGPAVVLLHGGNESARSHTQLALALADAFTVYLPDRRGRGRSGPHQPGHGLRTEVEDLAAVVAQAGAELVFGVSTGALIALSAARAGSGIRRVAAYEPALLLATSPVHRLARPVRPGAGRREGGRRAHHQPARAGPGAARVQAACRGRWPRR